MRAGEIGIGAIGSPQIGALQVGARKIEPAQIEAAQGARDKPSTPGVAREASFLCRGIASEHGDMRVTRPHRLFQCDVVLVAGAKELAGLVAELPADVGLDPAIEQRIDQHLDELTGTLTRRGEILTILL